MTATFIIHSRFIEKTFVITELSCASYATIHELITRALQPL